MQTEEHSNLILNRVGPVLNRDSSKRVIRQTVALYYWWESFEET
jgi:hypothetical protein